MAGALAMRKQVAISSCVHFCGYRYGVGMPNPYETYARGLASGAPLERVRRDFVDYILRYRPSGISAALGVSLTKDLPLWHLPWRNPATVIAEPGWVNDPEIVIDVMSFFAPAGVSRMAIEREFAWHENAFSAIRREGYQPGKYEHIRVREFCRGNESVFLVLDGNHRLSALSALGHHYVEVKQVQGTRVLRAEASSWPLVKNGSIDIHDALAIFDAFFSGVSQPLQLDQPASIV